MNQTKLESLLETSVNIASGFIVSLFLWSFIVAPLWGLEMSTFDNLGIVSIFTISAIGRGYVLRRFFNAGIHKMIHKNVKNLLKFELQIKSKITQIIFLSGLVHIGVFYGYLKNLKLWEKLKLWN